MSEDCPGRGSCHGCMVWCDQCGDVAFVCDSPHCDQHRRAEEVLRSIEEIEDEIGREARKCRESELQCREIRKTGESWQTKYPSERRGLKPDFPGRHELYRAKSAAESISSLEREVLGEEEVLRSIRYWAGRGCVMVPRSP